jgi:hypothetical protein
MIEPPPARNSRCGVRPDVDRTGVHLALLKKQQIARFGADIEQHRASFQIAIAEPERVAQRRWRHIHQLEPEPGALGGAEKAFHHIRLDRDQQHLQLAAGAAAHDLVIPDDFLQREGHILLRLVLDDLGDFGSIDRRQLDELREDMKAGRAHVCVLAPVRLLAQQFLDRLENRGLALALLGAFLPQRLDPKLRQRQRARFVGDELRDLDAARAKIEAQKWFRI